MSKVTTPVFKELEDGTMVLDKDVDVSTLSVEKDGSAITVTITNNGDGTYTFPITESGSYTLKLNGQVQSEFDEVYIPAEDNLTEDNLKASATRGYIEKDTNGDLQLKDGDTVLHQADVVDDYVTGGNAVPCSADVAVALKALIDGKEASDTTILKEADINSDISTGGTTKLVSAEVLKTQLDQNFTDPEYIAESKTIAQNIEMLDKVLAYVATLQGLVQYRTIYGETREAAAAAGSTPAAATEWQETATSDVLKIAIDFYKYSTDTKLIHHYQMKSSTGTGAVLRNNIDGTYVGTYPIFTGTSYADHTEEIDITSLSTGLHTLYVYIYALSGDTASYTKPVIMIRSN